MIHFSAESTWKLQLVDSAAARRKRRDAQGDAGTKQQFAFSTCRGRFQTRAAGESKSLELLVRCRAADESDSAFIFHLLCLYFIRILLLSVQAAARYVCLSGQSRALFCLPLCPTAQRHSAFLVRLCAGVNFRSHASSYIQLGGEISFCLGKLCHLTPS